MAGGENLTTLALVKEWLGITNDGADVLLARLIVAASRFLPNYLNRQSFALRTYAETYDGYGNSWMVIRNNPVYSVLAVSFAGSPKQAATGDGINSPYTNGWALDGQYEALGGFRRLNFYGYPLPRARSSVYVQYRAGYVAQETHNVPGGTPWQVTVNQFWLDDVSVSLEDGTVLARVDGVPGAGQYKADEGGVYTFNSAQEGETVLISYSFVPADIVQAATELVGERYRYLDRIGYTSKSLGGQETVSFSSSAMSSFLKESLMPYKNVVPV